MTSFVHTAYPAQHPGVARIESTVRAARQLRKGFDGTKGLAAMLLAAVVAALMVVANQMVDNWSDGHLLAAWVLMWAIGFAALALCAGTARRLAARAIARLDAWSLSVARARADARFLEGARNDPRVMAELRAALSRQEVDADVVLASQAPHQGWLSQYNGVLAWREGEHAGPARSRSWLEQYEPAFNLGKLQGAVAVRNDDRRTGANVESEHAVARRYSEWFSNYMKAQRVEEYPAETRAGGVWLQQV
ncbi:MAG: hypothetical protein ABI040_07285 [Rhodoferax sp.]